MKSIILIAIFFSFTAGAQVEFNPSQQILMTAKSCDMLQTYALSIMSWSEIIHNQKIEQVPECFCSSKSCQMDVAPISPYFVRLVTNFESAYPLSSPVAGPNCFNAALVAASTLSELRFTHPVEMTAILESPLCQERAVNEQTVPGDILVVRDQSNPMFEIHAGVYLSDELSFSKYGENSMMPYSYGMNVDKTYGVKSETCRRRFGTPAPGEECYLQAYVNIFSCRPFYKFISEMVNSPSSIAKAVQQIYADTTSYEMRVSDVAFKGASITADKLKTYQDAISILYSKSIAAEADTTLNADNRLLARLMKFRLFSTFEQTRRIAKSINQQSMVEAQLAIPQ